MRNVGRASFSSYKAESAKETIGREERPIVTVVKNRVTELAAENWKRRVKMDILAIAVALVLQDGPFFCLRMTLIFRHVSRILP